MIPTEVAEIAQILAEELGEDWEVFIPTAWVIYNRFFTNDQ